MRCRSVSLTTKLNLLLAIAGGVALLMSCIAFVTNDVRMLRATKIKHVAALAEVLAFHSVDAVLQRDVELARRVLSALGSQEHVTQASLYDHSGELLHHYRREESPSPVAPGEVRGYYFAEDGALHVVQSVLHEGRPIGAVHLRSSVRDLNAELSHYLRIVGLILVASLSASVLLSSRLQRLVSRPIVELTCAAQRISRERDYTIRVAKQSDDEIGSLYDEFNAMLDRVVQGEQELHTAHDQLESRVQERTSQLLQANLKLSREITERQRAEQELAILHRKLVDAAHRAGMAEIATDVLHNVGNVLNSVNVSCTIAAERLRQSSVPQVQRVAQLLDEHADRMAEFLTNDERGRHVPEFLRELGDELVRERDDLLGEVNTLVKNVDHIKNIVAMQQSYAGVSGVVEPVSLAESLEDAVRLNASWLEQHSVDVVRQYAPLPELLVQKQKLLQVLVNLVQNARDSLVESGRPDPRLTLSIYQTDCDFVRIDIVDNGVGIARENLTRIFSHGFTTKKGGHGFGLHSCANAAKEMGGRLTARSDGVGCGASFTLELPLKPAEVLA
jgi:signal transduction histidine kinase